MITVIGVLVVITIVVVVNLFYQKQTNAFCTSKRRLDGKTALVTGGTAGMGLEIAKDLAKRGARVIVCCPFDDEGQNGLTEIIKESGNKNIVFKKMDLASLTSVRKFAAFVLENEDRLDILVNNAGVSCPPDHATEDGLNFIMQVNYFGHFLLTILLMPLLRKSGKSRIVNTSSVMHRFCYVNLSSLNACNHLNLFLGFVYGKSKLCMIPFCTELTRRLENTGVVANSVDPGAVGTRIFDNCKVYGGDLLRILFYYNFKTPKEGAQTAIFAAVDESVENVSGKLFRNCKETTPSYFATGEKFAKRLFEETARLVKLTDDELNRAF